MTIELAFFIAGAKEHNPAAAQKLGRTPACMELRPEWARSVTERLSRGAQPR